MNKNDKRVEKSTENAVFFLRKICWNEIDISDKSDVIIAWLNVKKTWI